MKIEVKNFGCIKKGIIDLDKRFTVFVGYNNSGKTYMSQLLWGLNNIDDINFIINFGSQDISQESFLLTINSQIISNFLENYSTHIETLHLPEIFNVSKDYFSKDRFAIKFKEEFAEKFKIAAFNYLVFNGSYREYYSFKKDSNSLQILVDKKNIELRRMKDVSIELQNEGDYEILEIDSKITGDELIKYAIPKIFLTQVFDASFKTFFSLPTELSTHPTTNIFYSVAKEEKDLISDLLNISNSLDSIRALSKSPYTNAANALINNIYRLNTNPEVKNHFEDLLQELRKIIGGDIILKSAEGIAPIEFFLELDNGKELDMYMSSSSANQLATLYLYFKFWAEEKNNYLIIDEPEENLHPENQIKLVNLLMKFADRGNKVLITTHSPLITDHVNNYANLSHLAETGMDMKSLIAENKLDMVAVETIKKADYGVYFFNGDSIKEYTVDDYGVYFKDFAVAEDKVKDMSNLLKEKIYYNIHSDAHKPLQE